MSGQDRIGKIISDLKVLSLLSTGQTLSSSTMTIIPHNAWSSSVWRRYAGEDRKQTIAHIKGIFTEAITILKFNYNLDIVNSLEPAIKGFSSLKETYKGDYYTIAEIDRIIEITRKEASALRQSFSTQSHSSTYDKLDNTSQEEIDPVLEQCVEDVVRAEILKTLSSDNSDTDPQEDIGPDVNQCEETDILSAMTNYDSNNQTSKDDDSTQKICPDEDHKTEGIIRSEDASNIEELVSSSDRSCSKETTKDTISSNGSSNNSEDNSVLCNDTPIHVVNTETHTCNEVVSENLNNKVETKPSGIFNSKIPPQFHHLFISTNREVNLPPGGNSERVSTDSFDNIAEPIHTEVKQDIGLWSDTERVKELVKSASNKIAKIVVETSDQTTNNITHIPVAGMKLQDNGISDSAVSKSPKSETKIETTIIEDMYNVEPKSKCIDERIKSVMESEIIVNHSMKKVLQINNDSLQVNDPTNEVNHGIDQFNQEIEEVNNELEDVNQETEVNQEIDEVNNELEDVNQEIDEVNAELEVNQETEVSKLETIKENSQEIGELKIEDDLYIKETEPLPVSIIRTDLDAEYSSEYDEDMKQDLSDEFIKNIQDIKKNGRKIEEIKTGHGYSHSVHYTQTHTTSSDRLFSNYSGTSLAIVLSENQGGTTDTATHNIGTERFDVRRDPETIYLPMEYDVEAQEWRPNTTLDVLSDTRSEMESPTRFESNVSDGTTNKYPGAAVKSKYEQRTNTNTTRCPAFNSERSKSDGIFEEMDSTPPIIKLAKAFKRWVETISDENNEESEEYNSSGRITPETNTGLIIL